MYGLYKSDYILTNSEQYNLSNEKAKVWIESLGFSSDKPLKSRINLKEFSRRMKKLYGLKIIGYHPGYRYPSEHLGVNPDFFDDVEIVGGFENVAGFACKLGNQIFVYLNLHQKPERFRFTFFHEMVHVRYQIAPGKTEFCALMNTGDATSDYTDEQLELEAEANQISSQMILPSAALGKAIENGMSFSEIENTWHISSSALFNRFYDFLSYEIVLNPYKIKNVIRDYEFGNMEELQKIYARFIIGYDDFID